MKARERILRYYLLVFGFLNVFALSFAVPLFRGDRLLWSPRNLPIEMMMSSLYLAMGLVMPAAAREPAKSKLFVDFIILGNLLHALVMALYSRKAVHLVADVGVVGLMGLLPLVFYPWGLRSFLKPDQKPARRDRRPFRRPDLSGLSSPASRGLACPDRGQGALWVTKIY